MIHFESHKFQFKLGIFLTFFMECTICNSSNPKYKCPKCEIPYCSIPCFRKHRPDGEYKCKKEKAKLPDFKVLDNCIELKNMLQDEHLQKYITAIATNEHPNDIFDQLQQNPRYIEFESIILAKIKP